MKQIYDVLIAGGGVIGSSVACFLVSNPAFSGTVLVIEQDSTYEFCSTTRSWGGIRLQFTTPENIRMAQYNIAFLKNAATTLAFDQDFQPLQFREQGYLFLATEAGAKTMQANNIVQHDEGAHIELLDKKSLKNRFPWLNVEDLELGSFSSKNEGWLDPHSLLNGYRRKAIALGAEYKERKIALLLRDHNSVTGVQLDDGTKIYAGTVVNCAGWNAGYLAETARINLPVVPRKRITYVFDCREDLSDMPLTIDPSGVATRPESRQHLALLSPSKDDDPNSQDFEIDYSKFDREIWPILANRIPAFKAIKPTSAWAGHYDFNTFDQNAILGPHPEITGIIFCNGFSGHGVQQSPAVGRAIAELIVYGKYCTLDLEAFNYARILANKPIREDAIV